MYTTRVVSRIDYTGRSDLATLKPARMDSWTRIGDGDGRVRGGFVLSRSQEAGQSQLESEEAMEKYYNG